MSKEEPQKDLDLSDIDKIIHEPVRLSILAHLFVLDSADALFLKNQIGLNLQIMMVTHVIYIYI